ncbi:MAG TPA: ArsI/CadI family heavy metal resistance metalloenzyme [Kiloniellaceae bacterium]
MKRLHVHLRVDDLARSIEFYTALFGSAPSLVKHDYAKWQVDEPRVNFAVSKRGGAAGLDHLGIQVDDGAELTEVAERLSSFGAELVEQKDARCCYAHSDKAWARDPQGISWETFLTHGAASEDQAAVISARGPEGDCRNAAAPSGGCCAATSCGAPAASEACCA